MSISISSDAKWILGGLVGGFLLLGTMIVGSYLLQDTRTDGIAEDVASIKTDVGHIKADAAQIQREVERIQAADNAASQD